MSYMTQIIIEIEKLSANGIKECFDKGVNPNAVFNNQPLIGELMSGYMRGPQFKACVKTFVDYGLQFEDQLLLSVLLDDDEQLENILTDKPVLIDKCYSFCSAFTPINNASLLHICAEFNHIACAGVLIKHGLSVNVKAGLDENGFGNQTPIFHTVNQILNQSTDMLKLLLEHSADLSHTVTGIIWGKGYDWETLIPSVNPVSYAMMGLLPQMHRNERDIANAVSLLLKHKYGINYTPENIPCKYLHS